MTMRKRCFFLSFFLTMALFPLMAQEDDMSAITLADALEIGIENNLTLTRSQLNLINEEAGLLEAKGQRLPTLSTFASGRYNWGRSKNDVTDLFEDRSFGNINLGTSSNVTLFAGSQITNSIHQ